MRTRRAAAGSALVALSGVVGLAACGGSNGAASDGRLRVVTTVSPITNIVANIAGDLAVIEGVVPEGTNSHTFEPAPSTARLLADADVIYVNGLELEVPTVELARQNLDADADIVSLGERTIEPDDYIYDFSFPAAGGKPNPHLWTHPLLALRYAEVVADDLAERDPDNAPAYEANLEAFEQRIRDFDDALRHAIATVPAANRKLLTYHDSFAYFAADYGWDVIGAIQPSDFEEPTPKEVAALIDQIRAENVPAIFGSEVFPSPVLAQMGREAGVRYVDTLRDDDLPGEPGDVEHSLIGLLKADYLTIVHALGGDATALDDFDVANVTSDSASYPQ
jgi:ABC-type Zn uptake system ZnuABC Zn-binding protein ZnuA